MRTRNLLTFMLIIGFILFTGCGGNIKTGIDRSNRLFIAVLQPENKSGQADLTAEIADTDAKIIAGLLSTECFRIIDRDKLNLVMKEHGLSALGVVDPDRAAILGKLLGIDAILYTSVTKIAVTERKQISGAMEHTELESEAVIEGKIIDVAAGDLLVSGSGTAKSSDETDPLFNMINTKDSQDQKSLMRTSLDTALKAYCQDLGRRAVPKRR